MEKSESSSIPTKAKALQYVANGLSIARAVGGVYIGSRIARREECRSLPMVAAIGMLAATDYIDGKLARKAQSIDKRVATRTGKWLDQMADKVLTHSIIAGMTAQAYKTQNRYFAATLVTNQAVQLSRDIAVTVFRTRAESAGADTSAQRLGKIKTATGLIALAGLAVPPIQNFGKEQAWAGATMLTVSSALSAYSGISLVDNLAAQTANDSSHDELSLTVD